METRNNIDFKNLIGIKEWQEIQDNFSAVTHIPMRTVDINGAPLTKPSSEPRLCLEFIKQYPGLAKVCNSCLPSFLGGKETVDKNLSYSCALDLRNFIATLKIDKLNTAAYVIIGPVILITYKPQSEYKKFADQFNINLTDLYSAITEIKLTSFNSMLSVVELIEDVGNYLIKSSYKNMVQDKGVVAVDLDKLNRLLKVFLDVAFQVSGADLGSVMLLDKAKEELSILASKGLGNDIVKNARIKVGEGISGTVAREKNSLLIDDNLKNNRIKSYLMRPQLKSSMVLPIKYKNDVLGVVNLSTIQSSPVTFNSDDLKLMDRLVDLVVVALH
jgi:ligand-binding sensor protein/putative methionine-R-sulfoxide reductase with GAF domain